jgi:hypothetical protein
LIRFSLARETGGISCDQSDTVLGKAVLLLMFYPVAIVLTLLIDVMLRFMLFLQLFFPVSSRERDTDRGMRDQMLFKGIMAIYVWRGLRYALSIGMMPKSSISL